MTGFSSSTQSIPDTSAIPRHIAVIMDGNGRWAKKRLMPRIAGHRQGVEVVRSVVRFCLEVGVEQLTLFAFSSENWRRPKDEVSMLMELFMFALEREVEKLHRNEVRLRIIGDRDGFDDRLRSLIAAGEARTAGNTKLELNIAANYGGRWDILQAANRMLAERPECRESFSEADLTPYLSLAHAPEPDLFIRTGGERRISNFCIWQLAYTELYFTDTLWPDFSRESFDAALASYGTRERRFGRTSEQLGQRA